MCLLAAALACADVHAIEVATGQMLGPGYAPRAFYVREPGGVWTRTYSGSRFNDAAAGKLMNLRIAQGIFHDEWLTEFPFDADANTTRLIEALDVYREHGVLAINVSLQGGNPGYGREFAAITRQPDAKFGPGKGALISAFNPDGSLKKPWMDRLLRLVKELDRRGMVLDLMYFYQGQDEVLESPVAIERAVREATDWLIANDCRNVIIEIANEHDVTRYDHGGFIHREIGKLIELARSRFLISGALGAFREKRAAFTLPVSASTGGSMRVFDGVRDYADFVIIHGNNRKPDEKRKRVAELVADARMPGPIHMNEDDNGRNTAPSNLVLELASLDSVFEAGGGWGYMPWRQVQMFPFRFYRPASQTRVSDDMQVEQRDPAYFHAVLDAIRRKVLQEQAAAVPCRLR